MNLEQLVRQHSGLHAEHRRDLGQLNKILRGDKSGVPQLIDLTVQQPSINLPPTNDDRTQSIAVCNLSALPVYLGMLGGQAIAGNGIEIGPRQWVVFPFAQNIGMDIAVQSTLADFIPLLESQTVEVLIIRFEQAQAFASGKLSSPTTVSQVLQVAGTPAGANWSYTVPPGLWIRLLSGFGMLTTSAVAGNRLLGWALQMPLTPNEPGYPGLVTVGEAWLGANFAANTVVNIGYYKAANWTAALASVGFPTEANNLYLPALVLPPGAVLSSIASAAGPLLAGDQYSTINLLCETWNSAPIIDRDGYSP